MTGFQNENWASSTRGNVALIFAVAFSVLVPLLYFGFQLRLIDDQRGTLQAAADNAAISVVREAALVNPNQDSLLSIATTYVDANLSGNKEYLDEPRKLNARVIPAGSRENESNEPVVEITISQNPVVEYQTIFGFPTKKPITVQARAIQVGGSNVCIIALSNDKSNTMGLNRSARLTANNCLIFSNSNHSSGLEARGNSKLTADGIFSGGGLGGLLGNFSPEPVLDYPPIEDPLKNRQPPSFIGCDHHDFQTKLEEEAIIKPGVYCGGISVQNNAKVTMEPGIYIIKDGNLQVMHDSVLTGEGVGFYIEGNGSQVRFFHESDVTLSAPTTGVMAGLLFFDERNRSFIQRHTISSDNARALVGTIYMPRGRLVIDTNEVIADQSEYTAIIANQIQLTGSPNLVINSDYGATDVPVPDGLGPQEAGARLIR